MLLATHACADTNIAGGTLSKKRISRITSASHWSAFPGNDGDNGGIESKEKLIEVDFKASAFSFEFWWFF